MSQLHNEFRAGVASARHYRRSSAPEGRSITVLRQNSTRVPMAWRLMSAE